MRSTLRRLGLAGLMLAGGMILIVLSSTSASADTAYVDDEFVLYAGDDITINVEQQAYLMLRYVMQSDGNLVLYKYQSGVWQPIWHSGTNGNPGAWAWMQDDGNLVVFSDKLSTLVHRY